jgi:hypothetical protein
MVEMKSKGRQKALQKWREYSMGKLMGWLMD